MSVSRLQVAVNLQARQARNSRVWTVGTGPLAESASCLFTEEGA